MTPTPEQHAKRETPRCDAKFAQIEKLPSYRHDTKLRDFARTLETELQQLRLAADGMRDAIKRAIDGYQDVPEIPDGHSIMEISFGEFRQMTNALLAYRAVGEGAPNDTGTSRE